MGRATLTVALAALAKPKPVAPDNGTHKPRNTCRARSGGAMPACKQTDARTGNAITEGRRKEEVLMILRFC
ncbi:unnamed protein product, partial [Iphiclides podalirius]